MKKSTKITFYTFGVIMILWIFAWMLKERLDAEFPSLATSLNSFVYWTFAKLVIWIGPSIWLLRKLDIHFKESLNLKEWRSILLWGGIIGGLIGLTGIAQNVARGSDIMPSAISIPLMSSLIVAPLFEEFVARGAILTTLRKQFSFWKSNLLASSAFLIMHFPGWYFQGRLVDQLTNPIGAVSIFVLGLAFGYAAKKGRSFLGGSVAHFLNNLFAP